MVLGYEKLVTEVTSTIYSVRHPVTTQIGRNAAYTFIENRSSWIEKYLVAINSDMEMACGLFFHVIKITRRSHRMTMN